MGKFSKTILLFLAVGFGVYFGRPLWNFATNSEPPKISCTRMEADPNFKGLVDLAISVNSVCKLTSFRIFLDGSIFEVDVPQVVGKNGAVYTISLDSSDLSDGTHELRVVAVDGSYHAPVSEKKWKFLVDNTPLKAELEKDELSVLQGRTVHVVVQVNKEIGGGYAIFAGTQHRWVRATEHSNIYECFIPVECDARTGRTPLKISLHDSVGNNVELTGSVKVVAASFSRYAHLAISSDKLKDERENSVSSAVLESALEKWTQNSSDTKLWKGSFEVPTVVQRYSTPFGEIRTTAEKGRYVHKAVDIVNSPRHVVWASQAGKVIIKERFMMTGNTVAVDHGMGVITLYCHLDDFADIDVGDIVEKGNPVGKIGKTGYATGYHLHWELRVNNVAVDPLQWTQKTF